jgi:hypothetical protein
MTELARDGLARAVPVNSTPAELAEVLLDARCHAPGPIDHDWDDCASQLLDLYGTLAKAA